MLTRNPPIKKYTLHIKICECLCGSRRKSSRSSFSVLLLNTTSAGAMGAHVALHISLLLMNRFKQTDSAFFSFGFNFLALDIYPYPDLLSACVPVFKSRLVSHSPCKYMFWSFDIINFNSSMLKIKYHLTLRPPSTTIVPYANSLDLDETPSNSASHPDPSCLTLGQHFHQL